MALRSCKAANAAQGVQSDTMQSGKESKPLGAFAALRHSTQVPMGAASSLLGDAPSSSVACSSLLQSGLLTRSRYPEMQQAPLVDPAAKQALLDKLFASLQVVRRSKAAAAEGRSSPGQSTEARLLEQLSKPKLGKESPTGPLSRELSTPSISPSPTPTATQVPPSSSSSIPVAPYFTAAAPTPTLGARAQRLLPHNVGPAQQPQRQLSLPQQQHLDAQAVSTVFAQLAGVLPGNVQAPVLPSPQLCTQDYACAAGSLQLPFLLSGAPPAVVQYLQCQALLQQQAQQAFHAKQQWREHTYMAAQEECLVGPAGQYQPYCNQIITEDMNVITQSMLATLKMLQQADPLQGVWAKRFFCSIKEVAKVVPRAKCIIVAPDVKPNTTANINPVRKLATVIKDAEACGVPVVFALSRRGIGQVFGRDKSMSIVAVVSTEHCHAKYTALLHLAQQGRAAFQVHRCLHVAM